MFVKRQNGKGSITKLSGNRRKPFRARKSVMSNGKQIYIDIGCFKTYKEAETALNDEWGSNVYFISDGEFIKIGKANNVERRLKELQTGNPKELKILRIIKCTDEYAAYELETFLHSMLHSVNSIGEWFHLSMKEGDS
jgi:hypothetical protein